MLKMLSMGKKNDVQKVFYMKEHICLMLMNMKLLTLIYLKNWMISSCLVWDFVNMNMMIEINYR